MRRLRTPSTRRIVTPAGRRGRARSLSAGIAQAALDGSDPKPDPEAARPRRSSTPCALPRVDGVCARVTFTNGLLPAGSPAQRRRLPARRRAPRAGCGWPATAASGSSCSPTAGDAQIVADGKRLTIYDARPRPPTCSPSSARERKQREHEPADARRRAPRPRRASAEAWTLSGAAAGLDRRPARPTRSAIAPKDDGGLLGAAELAWDALNGVPLRAAVYAQGQDEPVLELAAHDVSYGAIPGSTLRSRSARRARSIVEIDPGRHRRPRPPDPRARRRRRAGAARLPRSAPRPSWPACRAPSVRLVNAGGAARRPQRLRRGHGRDRRAPARGRTASGDAGGSSCRRSTSTARPAPSSRRRSARS